MGKIEISAATKERIERIKFHASRTIKLGQDEFNGRILQSREDLLVIKELITAINNINKQSNEAI